MRTKMEINNYDTPLIKFRALKELYPTGEYNEAYNEQYHITTKWFELIIDRIQITWFAVWGEEE